MLPRHSSKSDRGRTGSTDRSDGSAASHPLNRFNVAIHDYLETELLKSDQLSPAPSGRGVNTPGSSAMVSSRRSMGSTDSIEVGDPFDEGLTPQQIA